MALSKFQMLEFQSWKGLTKKSHLGSIFQMQPQRATNIMVELLAYHRGKTLENYLMQFPTKYFEDDNEYFWEVIGSSRRNIPLVEARSLDGSVIDPTATPMVGVGLEPFFLVFGEDWFHDGELIMGEKNEVYPIRILGEARMEGNNAVYKVELYGVFEGIPAEELVTGKRFSWDTAVVEDTMSRQVGGVRYTTPVAMRNEWSVVRIKETVPGNMFNRKLAVGIPALDNGGKKVVHNLWMHHVDWRVEETFSEYKNNTIMYGKSNRNANGEYLNLGKSGNPIKTGDGLRAQMEYSNTIYYNVFTLKLIEDALYQLSASKLSMGDRTFVLRTGEMGAKLFHKAVLDVVSGWQVYSFLGGNAANPAIIHKTNSPMHKNSLGAGFQFTEFMAPNGVIVKVEIDELYDDQVRNKIMHPDGGVAMSYRFDILYIGGTDQPNIQLAKIKGQEEVRGYLWGLRNPFTGQWGNPNMSHDEDSATIHKMATLGVFILDPSRTMSIIPAILG